MAVVVPGELGQDLTEEPPAEDQHVVQALAAQRSNEPHGADQPKQRRAAA